MHVWGTYIGLKAERVQAGKTRDELLVKVEQLMNKALYEGEASEEWLWICVMVPVVKSNCSHILIDSLFM